MGCDPWRRAPPPHRHQRDGGQSGACAHGAPRRPHSATCRPGLRVHLASLPSPEKTLERKIKQMTASPGNAAASLLVCTREGEQGNGASSIFLGKACGPVAVGITASSAPCVGLLVEPGVLRASAAYTALPELPGIAARTARLNRRHRPRCQPRSCPVPAPSLLEQHSLHSPSGCRALCVPRRILLRLGRLDPYLLPVNEMDAVT